MKNDNEPVLNISLSNSPLRRSDVSGRGLWITNLRVLATLTVIMLHAAAGGIYRLGSIANSWWWICNVMNSFGRFAVPVFVMLSGYLLLGKYDNLTTFLKKRLVRIFIPFAIWTIIYMVWGNYYGLPGEETKVTFGEIIRKFLIGGAGGSGHLWFVYMLLGLYAFTPFISKWLKQSTREEMNFFFILWFISSAIYPYIAYFFDFQVKFELRYFSGYLGYFILGYYLGNRDFPFSARQMAWFSGIGFLASWGVTATGIYVFTVKNLNVYDSLLFDYLSPSVMLMSISMFLFFKNACNRAVVPTVMNRLDAASYGMYLCHLLVLRWFSRQYQINYTWHNPIVGIMAQFILTTIVCYIIIWFFSKLPKGKWITG